MSTKQIRNTTFLDSFGRPHEDVQRAIQMIECIKTTYDVISDRKEDKILFNLPVSVFEKVILAFPTSTQGTLRERYLARQYGYARTNKDHKGDLTDGKQRDIEVKTSNISQNGRVTFAGIRLSDEVDRVILGVVQDDKSMVAYEVKRKHLHRIPLYHARNTDDRQISFQIGGAVHEDVAAAGTVYEFNDVNTGDRWDSLRFLDEAGLDLEDVGFFADVHEDVRTAVAGTGRVRKVALDELLAIRPLVRECKFGLLVQDWVVDHLELATNRIPGRGDGVGKEISEVKYASLNAAGKFTIHGLKPGEFDRLYLALRTDDQIEFFTLTKRSAGTFVQQFGKKTNDPDGIYKVQMGSTRRSAAMDYLRRNKKSVDLNVRVH